MTFEVIPGSIAGHAGQLVLIEQREGAGKVQLQDLATAARSKVLLAALRGGEIGPHTELYDARIERRTIDDDAPSVARECERAVRDLLAGEGDLKPRIDAARHAERGVRSTLGWPIPRSGRQTGTVRLDAVRDRFLCTTIDEDVSAPGRSQ
jgi:hypothetical protein